jgi:hypothetical protein
MKTSQPRRRRTTSVAAGQIEQRNGAGKAADMSAAEMIDRSRPATADAVAQRAHELFIARGGAHGRDLDDWLEAERQLTGAA